MDSIVQFENNETVEDQLELFQDSKRNLLNDFKSVKSRGSNLEVGQEFMKIYLRIRPPFETEISSTEDKKCLETLDDHTIIARAPKDSHTFKNSFHGCTKQLHKFKFSKVFQENVTQKVFFDETMLGMVKDFLDGQNCLVYAYGITNGGKTYTMQGSPKDAGILPRTLDVIFNSIDGQQWIGMDLKPKLFLDVVKLSSALENDQKKIKEKVLKMFSDDGSELPSMIADSGVVSNTTQSSLDSDGMSDKVQEFSNSDEILMYVDNRIREASIISMGKQGPIKYSVWISFAEIYNEQIYDLLSPVRKAAKKRPCLRLAEDGQGNPYIRGLKEINVTSADEAYKLVNIGQKNLMTACTKLNQCSSRSHCIFTIKLLRVVDKGDPHVARVSLLSLCDLAGSERYSKTQSTGERLKEAGNINASLLTLGRCIEMMRYNQNHNEAQKIIPFRESKLTRLFQSFFNGRGKAAMIVNVNQSISAFDETLHVFRFSAIAKQVVITQKQGRLPLLSSTQDDEVLQCISVWSTPGNDLQTDVMDRFSLVNESEDEYTEREAIMVEIIEELKQNLTDERKARMLDEVRIRQEVCKEMMNQFVEIEYCCSERIREHELITEELADKRINEILETVMPPRKRPRSERMAEDDNQLVPLSHLIAEQTKNKELEQKIEGLNATIEKTKTHMRRMTSEHGKLASENSSFQFQLVDMKKNYKSDMSEDLEEMRRELEEAQKTIEELKSVVEKLKAAETALTKDLSTHTLVIENLTKELKDVRDQNICKDSEVKELNEMLTDAGDTFRKNENTISQYKERFQEQDDAYVKLQKVVTDTKLALEAAQLMVLERDQQLNDYKKTKNILQEKLKREEEKSFKQEQALIHGYKAEIENYKLQITKLKVEKMHSKEEQKSSKTPDKEAEQLFKHDLSRQVNFLQLELDKNSIAVAEAQQALEMAKSTSGNLEQQLAAEKMSHHAAKIKITELECKLEILQKKCDEESSKLEAELKCNEEKVGRSEDQRERTVGVQTRSRWKMENQQQNLKVAKEREIAVEKEELQCDIKGKDESICELQDVASKINKLEVEIMNKNNQISLLQEKEKERNDLKAELQMKTKEIVQLQDMKKKSLALEDEMSKKDEVISELKVRLERIDGLEFELKLKNKFIYKLEKKNEELDFLTKDLRKMVNETSDLNDKTKERTIMQLEAKEKALSSLEQEMELMVARSKIFEETLKSFQLGHQNMKEKVNNETIRLNSEVEICEVEMNVIRKESDDQDNMRKIHILEVEKADLEQGKVKEVGRLSSEKENLENGIKHIKEITMLIERSDGIIKKNMDAIKLDKEQFERTMNERIKKLELEKEALAQEMKMEVEKLKLETTNLLVVKSENKKLFDEITALRVCQTEKESQYNELIVKCSNMQKELENFNNVNVQVEELKSSLRMEQALHMQTKSNFKETADELEELKKTVRNKERDIDSKQAEFKSVSRELLMTNKDLETLKNSHEQEKDLEKEKTEKCNLTKESGKGIARKSHLTVEMKKICGDSKAESSFADEEMFKTDIRKILRELEEEQKKRMEWEALVGVLKRELADVGGENLGMPLENRGRQLRREKIAAESAKLEAEHALKIAQVQIESLEVKIKELEVLLAIKKSTSDDSQQYLKELEKVREWEKSLRSELHKAGISLHSQNSKLMEMEEEAQQKTELINKMETEIKDQQERFGLMNRLQQQLDDLKEQLVLKDRKVEELKNMAESLEEEQSKVLLLEKDKNTTSRLIETLKISLREQEATMATQDRVLTRKEEEAEILKTELERLRFKYTQSVETSNHSVCEIHKLMQQQATLEVQLKQLQKLLTTLEQEKSQLKKDAENREETINMLSEENSKLNRATETNHLKLKNMEILVSDTLNKCDSLRTELEKPAMKNGIQVKSKDEIKQVIKLNEMDLQKRNDDIKSLKTELMKKEDEMKKWRCERDKLVKNLEEVLRSRDNEIRQLKAQLDQNGSQELAFEKAESLRKSNIKTEKLPKAKSEFEPVQFFPVTEEESNVEEYEASRFIEIDATPPVAAKALKKNRKRKPIDLLQAITNQTDKSAKKVFFKKTVDKDNIENSRVAENQSSSKMFSSESRQQQSKAREFTSDLDTSTIMTRSAKRLKEQLSNKMASVCEKQYTKDEEALIKVLMKDNKTRRQPYIDQMARPLQHKHEVFNKDLYAALEFCDSFIASSLWLTELKDHFISLAKSSQRNPTQNASLRSGHRESSFVVL